jgi:uncharacterized protein YggE
MRRFILPLTTCALALVLAASAFSARTTTATAAPAADADLRSTVTVLGDGRVLVQPDVATASFGVEANGPTLAEAQADASTRMQAVIDTLIGLGVPREEIKTNRLSVNPVYDPQDNSVVRGYRANNSVQVTLHNLDQVGSVVDAVTAAGANRVNGVSFSVDDLEAPKAQARALAVQNARVKADQLAGLAGMRITAVKSMEESDGTSTPVRPQAMAARAEAAPPPPVEPGSQEVRTQVNVTYIMEP